MSKIFFTSDLHLDHTNIIKYCDRPFKNVTEMNRAIINNWNNTVAPEDMVYVLGDFALGPIKRLPYLRSLLSGQITLIRGNHDRSTSALKDAGFTNVYDNLEIEIEGLKLYLQHIPTTKDTVCTAKSTKKRQLYRMVPHCDYFLCGHVHNNWSRRGNVINVGVDVNGFTPRTLKELIK